MSQRPSPGKVGSRPRVRVLGSRGPDRHTQAALVRRAATEALHSGGWAGAATIDVLLRDEDGMRSINARSRGIDEPTDVLSFPLFELHPGQTTPHDAFILPPGTLPHLGDVVVCTSRAGQQALEYGHSFERERAYLTVHGVLHLLGYDHEQPTDRQMMRDREEASLAALGLPREVA